MEVKNEVRMKVLDDGTISVSTDNFGDQTTHQQAEDLIKTTFELVGGKSAVQSKIPHAHSHVHTHGGSSQSNKAK
jgi:hypothetical protein